jgi:hypothetical protein
MDTEGPDFDTLVEASRDATNKVGEQTLWRAVFSLDVWYFVARGEGEDAEPLIGVIQGKPALLIFTEEERAAGFARARNMRRSDVRGSARDEASMAGTVLHMDREDAVEYCEQLAGHGVEWALFNSGPYAFQCPMIEMRDRARRYTPR